MIEEYQKTCQKYSEVLKHLTTLKNENAHYRTQLTGLQKKQASLEL